MNAGRIMRLGWIGLLLCNLLPGTAVAADEQSICSKPVIDRVFATYEKQAGRQQIIKIQHLLLDGGYDPGRIDGYTGTETDGALERLCFDFGVDAYLGEEAAEATEQAEDAGTSGESTETPPAAPAELALFLVKLLEKSAPVSEKYPGWMPLVRGKMFASWLRQEPATNLLQMLDAAPEEWPGRVLALLDSFPGRKPPPNNRIPEIQLFGDNCGCSRDFSALVYGFYPHWLANGKQQLVDFSLLDRIGFFTLKLNREGEIPDPLYWQESRRNEPNIAGFINKAHKYRVEVDVIFYASAWQEWSDEAIDKAVKNMVSTLQRKFSNPNAHWLRKVLPLVEDTSAVGADGITLYFDRYREGDGNRLLRIVERLTDEMDAVGTPAEVNVMLGGNLMAAAQDVVDDALIRGLVKMILENENNERRLASVLLFLPEPTTDSKKQLRQKIESALHGSERKTLLRRIVPIVMAEQQQIEAAQFDDDLIYFQDNFAGVGLWPLALDETREALKEKLLRHYQANNDDANYLGDLIDRNFPAVCEFVCPNRWVFRAAVALLAALLLVYVLLVLWNCRLRAFYQRYFIYFIAVGIADLMVYVISLVCDPVWEGRADRVVISILLLIVGGFLWRYLRKLSQPPLP